MSKMILRETAVVFECLKCGHIEIVYSDMGERSPDECCECVQEPEPDEELEIDDRAPCKGCGIKIGDGEYQDNHGYCDQCADRGFRK